MVLTDPFDRIPYSPIVERPRLTLPNGARVALWVVPNIEHYEYLPRRVAPRDPWARMPHPDVLGYAIRDYGNRAGLWRMFDVMDRLSIRCTVSLSMSVYDRYPEIMEGIEGRGWDVLCHGLDNTHYLWGMGEAEERATIAECQEIYRRTTGKALLGWFSPSATFTANTPDLVAEAGFRYYCDFYHDDQPTWINVRSGRLMTLPYQMDVNDAMAYRHHFDAAEFERMMLDHFECLYEEGAETARIVCIALHPYIMGQPHRIAALERALGAMVERSGVWVATGTEISDWFLGATRGQEAPAP
ncbi:polysaccharide deacetylase family protein [Acuticoccus kandeliae]|uniref:polysaccharide deacetylase family protein n=1 Tax=Acuticoccus kandeliae TaxID=2073160 RepID=UPI000D3E6817|nr:polysaccharide deacetylase family protein [Acuticoccus kandeliae]